MHCTLNAATLTDERQHQADYEALSYVWGDAKGSRCLYVNDHAFSSDTELRCCAEIPQKCYGNADALDRRHLH